MAQSSSRLIRLGVALGLLGLASVVALPRVMELVLDAPMPTRARLVPEACPVQSDDERFFQRREGRVVFDLWTPVSRMWTGMSEPILACGPSQFDEVYRVTWSHAFAQYSPFIVRGTRTGRVKAIVAAEFAWPAAWSRDLRLAERRRTERALSDDEWVDLIGSMQKAQFWEMSSTNDRWGADGSSWLLEARRGSGYHVVERWSPEDGPFRSLGLTLMRLGGFEEPTID
jgi:hypothetical protein